MPVNGVMALILCYFREFVYDIVVKSSRSLSQLLLSFFCHVMWCDDDVDKVCLFKTQMVSLIGQLADTPSCGWPTRGLVKSQTGQIEDWTSHGLVNSRTRQIANTAANSSSYPLCCGRYFEDNYKSSAVADMGDRLATIDIGRKFGAVPLLEGAGPSSNTMSSGLRPTSVPSGILIHPAVWPQ